MQRCGQPIEVAKGIAFLASDLASFTTGVQFHIDGGLNRGGSLLSHSELVKE